MEMRCKKAASIIIAAVMMLAGSFVYVPEAVAAEETLEKPLLMLERLDWDCTNPDRNNLEAGDVIYVTATIRNNGSEIKTINPVSCGIMWKYEEVVDGIARTGVDGIGEQVAIQPGGAGQISFEYLIGKFEVVGKRMLVHIEFETSDGYTIKYQPGKEDSNLIGYEIDANGNSKEVEGFEHGGNVDFNVPESPGFDWNPPIIYSMETDTESVHSIGEVTYQLELRDYGLAKPTNIWVTFQDVSNERNSVEFVADVEELGQGVFTCTFSLNSELSKGTYRISQIDIWDENPNIRRYTIGDSGLEAYNVPIFNVANLIIEASQDISGDIDGDGQVTMTDLMLCMNHYVGKAVLADVQFKMADVNGDNVIDMVDMQQIMNGYLKKQ